jgi:hypothetical protein
MVGVACDGMTDDRSDGMLSHPAIMIDASNMTKNNLYTLSRFTIIKSSNSYFDKKLLYYIFGHI